MKNNNSNNFKQDLANEKIYTDAFLQILKDKGCDYTFIEFSSPIKGNHKDFDVKIKYKNKIKLLELKQQHTHTIKSTGPKYTGNIVIEHTCYGRPSGINSTKSDVWINIIVDKSVGNVKATDTVYFVISDTQKLRNFIKDNSFFSVSGGDNSAAQMYLVNIHKHILNKENKSTFKVLFKMPIIEWDAIKNNINNSK